MENFIDCINAYRAWIMTVILIVCLAGLIWVIMDIFRAFQKEMDE